MLFQKDLRNYSKLISLNYYFIQFKFQYEILFDRV